MGTRQGAISSGCQETHVVPHILPSCGVDSGTDGPGRINCSPGGENSETLLARKEAKVEALEAIAQALCWVRA